MNKKPFSELSTEDKKKASELYERVINDSRVNGNYLKFKESMYKNKDTIDEEEKSK